MFTQVGDPTTDFVTIYFERRPLKVAAGTTVASAVLDAANGWTRITRTGRKRGPYCHMGVCYECLMNIDGQPNQQACQTIVAENMQVFRQNGVPDFNQSPALNNSGEEALDD